MRRRLHRLAGLLLALPLVLWIATGFLFHVKHRYAEAYEALRVPGPAPAWQSARLSPADLFTRSLFEPASRPFLGASPGGVPVYFGAKAGAPVAVDAGTGVPLPPASEETAVGWARAAVAASAHSGRYGSPSTTSETRHASSLTGAEDPAFAIAFSGGKTLTVDRITGEVSQTGALNDWIDWTYRIHYLQWTPWKAVNIALVLIASPLALFLAFTGLTLARAKIPREASGP
jgi:uncharacterized iron-regulated membrane protein